MSRVDLVIHGGVVSHGGEVSPRTVTIADGRVIAIGDDAVADASEVIDASGCLVLPGVIDPHVHYRDPGLTDREDFGSGSLAAAFGGVSTVFDMPNTVPPTSSAERLEEKRNIATAKSVVDFGLFGIVSPANLDKIAELADGGVIGFKFYLHQTMEGMPPCDDGALLEAFKKIAKTGLRAAIHAENPSIINHESTKLRERGRTDVLAFHEARPPVSESEMVDRCITYAKVTGVKLHICHVTSEETVALVSTAKSDGVDITAETGPQWLWFTRDDVPKKGGILVFSPPFRAASDRDALWQGLRDGTIDMIASDHSPRNRDEKFTESVWDAKSGFAGVETAVPLLLSAVHDGRLSVAQYTKITSENAARAFGLWPKKGSLLPGSDADVTIVRTGTSNVVAADALHSRARTTPFEGTSVSGEVAYTIVRGRVVIRDGKYGGGQWGNDVRLHDQ